MENNFYVSSSPHVRTKESIHSIMRDVLIALAPALLFSFYLFGFSAILTVAISTGSAVFFEWGYCKVMKKPSTIHDLSAVVTGVLLGMNLPALMHYNVLWWISILGSFFAIIIVKQLFGGLGQNFMNPALGARAFLLISYAGVMTTWLPEGASTGFSQGAIAKYLTQFAGSPDAMSGATTLYMLGPEAGDSVVALPPLWNVFLGTTLGSLGETSALLLLLGGVYLIFRKVITYHVPVFYLGTFFIFTLIVTGFDVNLTLYQMFSGGLMIGAIFMATDYASSPQTALGKIIMGVSAGILTVLIRFYGAYPEGVSFAIIIMNLFTPIIDKFTIPVQFGGGKHGK